MSAVRQVADDLDALDDTFIVVGAAALMALDAIDKARVEARLAKIDVVPDDYPAMADIEGGSRETSEVPGA